MKWRMLGSDTQGTRTLHKLDSFRNLPTGWSYGRGGPISEDVISDAKEIYESLVGLGLSRTNAFPGTDGEILVTAYHGSHYVSITIEKNHLFSYRHEQGDIDHSEHENVRREEVKSAIRMSARIIWPTFALFTRGGMTHLPADSTTWRSRILQTA